MCSNWNIWSEVAPGSGENVSRLVGTFGSMRGKFAVDDDVGLSNKLIDVPSTFIDFDSGRTLDTTIGDWARLGDE